MDLASDPAKGSTGFSFLLFLAFAPENPKTHQFWLFIEIMGQSLVHQTEPIGNEKLDCQVRLGKNKKRERIYIFFVTHRSDFFSLKHSLPCTVCLVIFLTLSYICNICATICDIKTDFFFKKKRIKGRKDKRKSRE